jgi:hypothetical protein
MQLNPAANPAVTPLPVGVPPLSSLVDEYSKLCDAPKRVFPRFGLTLFGTKLPYFDAEELAKLSSQLPPVDHFLAGCNGKVPHGTVKIHKDVEAAPGSQPPSLAETVYGVLGNDKQKGVSSCDELLHEDSSGVEIMKFLNTFNSKPLWAVEIEGSHEEVRSNGRHPDDHVKVIDFTYKVDITYVCAIGEERSPL